MNYIFKDGVILIENSSPDLKTNKAAIEFSNAKSKPFFRPITFNAVANASASPV